ncbi:MAG: carboxypeptidase regulatory-like domain-containing protein [Bryobacteraceae bacterium]
MLKQLPLRLFLIQLALCPFVFGQLTLSTIRGVTQDPSGAVVGGASIRVTSLGTNATREVRTSDSGDFEIPDLPRGTYRLTATAAGFKTFVADDIILEGNQIRRLNVQFEIGAVGSEVTVKAGAALIQTDGAKIQTDVDTSRHYDTPWVGGMATLDPSLFITTAPLVSQSGGIWGSQWAGHSSGQVQEGQDGHTNDDAVNQINDIMDAQEVTVVTVNNTAEFARVGYMNLVTKAGTNEFHAQASYWNQNSALAARQFFSDSKTKVLLHTISANASGPIIKDRLFFFASANIMKIPSKQFYLRTVPTAQMRTGDFSQLLSSGITIKDPTSGLPFASNQVPTSRISSVSRAVTDSYIPSPNRGDSSSLSNNYGFTFPFPEDYHLRKDFTQRIDYQLTSKNRLMGRLIENWGLYVLPTNFQQFTWTRTRFDVHMVVEDTHVFSPSLINTARFGWYKEKYTDGDPLYGVTPFKGDEAVKAIGLQGVNPKGYSAEGFPIMSISGYPTLSTQAGGSVTDHDYGYADTVTWSKGRHVFKFGGEYKPQTNINNLVPSNSYGNFSFNGSFSSYGYADFLLGIPYASTRLDPLTNRTRHDSELGIFIQDSWKVTNRLTLDLGLRWDRFGSPEYEDGLMLNWDPRSGNVIIPAGTESKISGLYPSTIKLVTGDVRMSPSSKNFVPRIGAAYRLTDKTVIRGGYGIFNETLGRYAYLQGTGPFQISETYQNVITSGVPMFTFPNPFPSSLSSAKVPSQSVTGYPVDATNGKIHQYNLTIEQQYKDTGFRLSYVGSHDYGMHYGISVNKPQPSLIPFTASRRPYPQYVGASYYRNDGEAKFNALTFEVVRKVGQLTLDSHWSLSSSYSNMSNLESPYSQLLFSRDTYTPRNRVVMNIGWDIPIGKGRHYLNNANPVLNGVLGGWQLYWVGYLESGHFFSPYFSGSDPSNTNTSGGLPNRVCNGNLPSGQRSLDRWFDASCFAVPSAGMLGNSGANVLEGPGYNNQNISLAKTFAITERLRFTFTAAASDAFNHPNFTAPDSNISAPGSVGVVSGLVEGAASRQIELRGRLQF